MPSLPQTKPVLSSAAKLAFILLFLASSGISGASLRDHAPPHAPDADMLKALEYIQSLDPRQRGPDETPRAALRHNHEEEEEEEDRSAELLQAVLSALRQAEGAPGPGEGGAHRGIAPRRKTPAMFEDDEGEEDEGPFKRTNENVEEKYTPQKLATLQSAFQELRRLPGSKVPHRRHEEEEEEEEDEGLFDERSAAYDEGPLRDWGRLEEEEEEGGKDPVEYPDSDEEADDEGDEEEEEGFPVKRSGGADDSSLVDYFLLRVLQQTEEEQRREEERAAERRQGDELDSRVLHQLLSASQTYRIPPEDLLRMLRAGEQSSRMPPLPLSRAPPHSRQSAEAARTEEVLRVLGLGGAEDPEQRPPGPPRPARVPAPPQRRPADPLTDDYDDSVDEDELAAYLAAQMLAPHPRPASGRSPRRDDAGRSAQGAAEGAEGYFDLLDSEKSPSEKRQTEDEERDEDSRSQGFESDAVMKLLSLLEPETQEAGPGK